MRLDATLWDGALRLRDALLAHGSVDDLGRVVLSFGTDVLVVTGVAEVASLFDDAALA